MTTTEHNWAGNIVYSAARIHHPETIDELRRVVVNSRKIRVLGSRHSFNTISDSAEDLVSLDKLDQTISLDRERRTVTVSAGVTYGRLCPQLDEAGLALHNLASLPHISVAGAIATATHGSGDANGNLATAVSGLEIVTADGDLVNLSREKDGAQFDGAVVNLGALGVVTRVTLDVVPAFFVQQEVFEGLPIDDMHGHFDDIATGAYSVSLFHDWQGDTVSEVWLKRHLGTSAAVAPEPTFFGAKAAQIDVHPVMRLSAAPCTPQLGVVGPWHERLPHFRVDHTPASGDELQSEYFVPRQHIVPAMQAVAQIGAKMADILWISELRTIAGDTLWMSPCYQQACVGFHFSWKRNWPAVQQFLPMLEAQLAPFDPRPHWGKLFTMPATRVQQRYSRLNDFRSLLNTYDPQGKFRNAFIDAYVFG